MTVKELIEELKKLNPESEVWAFDDRDIFFVDGVHEDEIITDGIPSVTIEIR